MSRQTTPPPHEGPKTSTQSNIVAAAIGVGAGIGVLQLENRFFARPRSTSRVASLGIASLAGLAVGYGAHRYAQQRAAMRHQKQHPFTAEFRGFSAENPPTPEGADRYVAYLQGLAHSGTSGALDAALNGLEDAGLAHVAASMRRHRAIPENTHLYATVDRWLSALAERSPETFTHIQRELVMLAFAAETMPPQPTPVLQDAHIARILMAGLTHDIGKLAIDPALLHKATRMPEAKLEAALAEYTAQVPDYEEKNVDMALLRLMNRGLVPVANAGDATPAIEAKNIITTIQQHPTATEPAFASPELLASIQQVVTRMQEQAIQHNVSQLIPLLERDSGLINYGRRGTLSASEMAIMDSHDQLGCAMAAKIGIDSGFGIDPAVVNSKLPDTRLSQDDKALRDLVHMTDLYEAVTGNRAYNRNNGKVFGHEDAMKILTREVEKGHIAPENLSIFIETNVAERFQRAKKRMDHATPDSKVVASSITAHPMQPATTAATARG
jgi:HD-GYP domain-containing protein (c-di-GMP phosphodiesterase class II)